MTLNSHELDSLARHVRSAVPIDHDLRKQLDMALAELMTFRQQAATAEAKKINHDAVGCRDLNCPIHTGIVEERQRLLLVLKDMRGHDELDMSDRDALVAILEKLPHA